MILLFDLDGTLIDSTEAILESFHNSFDVLGHPHPEDEEIIKLIGYPLDIMYKELGIDANLVDTFVQTYKEHYRKISTQKTVLLKNAKQSIIEASKIAKLGIVTTKTGRYSQVLMEHFGLMEYFDVLIGREQVKFPKPNAEPILTALKSFNTTDEEIFMIGDTKLDLVSAKSAGVKSIGVLSGSGDEKTLRSYTNMVFDDTLSAINYLKSRKKPHK